MHIEGCNDSVAQEINNEREVFLDGGNRVHWHHGPRIDHEAEMEGSSGHLHFGVVKDVSSDGTLNLQTLSPVIVHGNIDHVPVVGIPHGVFTRIWLRH
jgi:hypothetical protein